MYERSGKVYVLQGSKGPINSWATKEKDKAGRCRMSGRSTAEPVEREIGNDTKSK